MSIPTVIGHKAINSTSFVVLIHTVGSDPTFRVQTYRQPSQNSTGTALVSEKVWTTSLSGWAAFDSAVVAEMAEDVA